jgi:hypothetical protein
MSLQVGLIDTDISKLFNTIQVQIESAILELLETGNSRGYRRATGRFPSATGHAPVFCARRIPFSAPAGWRGGRNSRARGLAHVLFAQRGTPGRHEILKSSLLW